MTNDIGKIITAIESHPLFLKLKNIVENNRRPSLKAFYDARSIPGVLGSKQFQHYVSGLGFEGSATKKTYYSVRR